MRLSDGESRLAEGAPKHPGPPRKRTHGVWFAAGFGALLGGVGGLLLGYAVPRVRAEADGARALPVATPATLASHAFGARLLVEARIGAAAPEAFREFVAFTRQEFRGWREEGGRRRERWDTLETIAPPLPLADVADETSAARIVNSGYALQAEPRQWQSTANLVFMEFGERTQRLGGFGRGDAVTVDATLVAPGALEARSLIGGTRESYLAALEKEALTLSIVGAVFAGVGGVLAIGALFTLLRKTSPGQPPPSAP